MIVMSMCINPPASGNKAGLIASNLHHKTKNLNKLDTVHQAMLISN